MPSAPLCNAMSPTDCLVVGGGPAGLLAALLLAEWGRDVLVVDDGERRSEVLPEYVGHSKLDVLQRLGILPLLKAVDPVRPQFSTDRRGGVEARVKHNKARAPFCVDYEKFIAGFRRFVQGRGVRLLEGVGLRSPVPSGPDAWVRLVDADGFEQNVQSKLVILAQGAISVFTTSQVAVSDSLPETVSMSLLTQPGKRPIAETTISTSSRGVLQCRPTHNGGTHLILTIDRLDLNRKGQSALWAEAIAVPESTVSRRPMNLRDSTLRLVTTRDANLMFGSAAIRHSLLETESLASDLRSAEAAALAANTILNRPSEHADIIDHHRNWERERFLTLARSELKWCAKETRFPAAPFWMSRVDRIAPQEPRRACPHRYVACRHLERRSSYQREGQHLTTQVAFGLQGDSATIGRVGDVPIEPLLDLMKHPQTREQLVQAMAANRSLAMTGIEQIHHAIDELCRLRFIEGAD